MPGIQVSSYAMCTGNNLEEFAGDALAWNLKEDPQDFSFFGARRLFLDNNLPRPTMPLAMSDIPDAQP